MLCVAGASGASASFTLLVACGMVQCVWIHKQHTPRYLTVPQQTAHVPTSAPRPRICTWAPHAAQVKDQQQQLADLQDALAAREQRCGELQVALTAAQQAAEVAEAKAAAREAAAASSRGATAEREAALARQLQELQVRAIGSRRGWRRASRGIHPCTSRFEPRSASGLCLMFCQGPARAVHRAGVV
jgi:hypothetical protein